MAEKIKLLFVGDVVGIVGLEFLKKELKGLIESYGANFVVVNGENIENGKGLNEVQAEEIFALGVDVITTGNHIWDNWKSRPLMAKNDRVIRPYNYPPGNVGKGFKVVEKAPGLEVAVVQLQGRTYMQAIDCPFRAADNLVKMLSERTPIIIVDFHADATAEKVAMGWHLDGRASAVIGTHTHIPTADASILMNGTAYISDVGMTGPYDSVVGMRKDIALKRLLLQTAHKYEQAIGDLKLCAVYVEIDSETGQAMKIEQIILPKFVNSMYDQVNENENEKI
ncbi:MAG: TIGR00282 family metallophosphoesterase [Candidatus Kapabacteria bacterium]|nr:TIGR00282 family metallophosphoesterase [Candidatus Kapabacteria bacterium]